ncbi:CBS domain-containing protein [Paracoccus aerodenitrificans]|uniref:CBS domain-containing protein n=1 Tax=Paracoccus aerodenitrificans TaxID=3017781 RepID=UPI0022F1352E|nr:CBS domain-containing protein [Paracoccus aerodenitrificans]WBU63373.1 CBS domain-containing protein [Paracoccus aerodenitrificans]
MLVKQILSLKAAGAPEIVTIASDATVADAARLLAEKRIGAIVVSDDGARPAGILSERDIVRELSKQGADVLQRPVSELMTRKVSTCLTGEDTLAVLERMTEGRFRHLPVVDEDGNMLGIVSIGDAVSARLKELSDEKDALTGMIMGS